MAQGLQFLQGHVKPERQCESSGVGDTAHPPDAKEPLTMMIPCLRAASCMGRLILTSTLASLTVVLGVSTAHAVTIDMVTVGNAGNANNTTGYGRVVYDYQIGKYDVTIGQYTAFLNAVAATDTYSLYNGSMATNLNVAGIAQNGSSGSYTYSVIAPSGTTPAGASSPVRAHLK